MKKSPWASAHAVRSPCTELLKLWLFSLNRDYATPDDVKFLAPHVLSHRLIPTGGRKAKTIVERLLRSVADSIVV